MRWLMTSSAWSWPMTRAAEVGFQVEHGGDFVLEHLADGNAGPAGDDFADDLGVHADAHQRRLALHGVELGIELRELRPHGRGIGGRLRGPAAAAAPSRPAGPAAAASAAGCGTVRLELHAQFADRVDQVALLVPTVRSTRLRYVFGFGARLGDRPAAARCDRRRQPLRARGRASARPGRRGCAWHLRWRGGMEFWPRARRAQAVSSTLTALSGNWRSGKVAVRELHARRAGLRRGCGRCGASRALARRRAASARTASRWAPPP